MRGLILFLLLSTSLSIAHAQEYSGLEYVVKGLWWCTTAFFHDLFTKTPPTPLDAYKTIPEIILTAGYQFETHKIVTPDDYINTAWRITGKLVEIEDPHPERKPCVILQHGLLDNSATWFILNASVALPFQLVDRGYDVWLTNSRGNINSYEHMHPDTHDVLDPSSDYFRFSWDEMAKYDVPTNLNYVLRHSNYKKAFYVGHSQGTTQFFAAADVIEDLEDKVAGYIALAPVMYVGNMGSPFMVLLAKSPLAAILGWLKEYNFFILPDYFSPISRWFGIKFRTFVWRLFGLAMGIDEKIRIDLSRMPVAMNHEPGGTSYFNMVHWMQSIVSGEFGFFDYGSPAENMKHYNLTEAPLYNTTHIAETLSRIPTLMFAGENDALVSAKDLAKLEALVEGSTVEIRKIDHYAHVDYIWGMDCPKLVFEPLIQFIMDHTDSFESY